MYGKWYIILCSALKMLLFVFLLGLFSISPGQFQQEPPSDKWVLNFDSPVYVCTDEKSVLFVDTSNIEVIRHNETIAFLTGFVLFLQGLHENTMVELLVEKEGNGRYEQVLSHEICDLCSEIANADSDYHDYLKYFGFPDKCPFEAGEYNIHDYVANTEDFPVNSQNAGRYQVTINLHQTSDGTCTDKEKEFLACLKLDFVIEQLD